MKEICKLTYLLKKNTLPQLWICFLNNVLKYNTRAHTVKAYMEFDPWLQLDGLNAPKTPDDWSTQQIWVLILLAFDF